MIKFAREQASDVVHEIKPLLEAHWREIAHFDDIPLEPDWQFYMAAKTLRVFTARDDGRLVGYGIFFISPNRHYLSSIQAVQDILFISPEYRGRTVGPRLIAFCDEQLMLEGAQAVYHHVKPAKLDFGPLLLRMGYEFTDAVYAKRLDRSGDHGRNSSGNW